MTVGSALRAAAHALAESSDTARLDAELLMAHALGISRSELLLRHMDAPVPREFAPLLERRLEQEPIAYILGRQEFFGLEFSVNPAVLIPRADSEVLVERALADRPNARTVLDCGTGSGALLLAVLANLPDARGLGIDVSSEALTVARGNAAALGLDRRARFQHADWNHPDWRNDISTSFDLVLANPPYVEDGAVLMPSVRDFEPAQALFAGPDGLNAYRSLLPQVREFLAPDGIALVEIGATQAGLTMALAESAGLCAQLVLDLGNRPRVLRMSHLR